MVDPLSVSEWITYGIDRLIALATNPVLVPALLVVLFRRPLAGALTRFADRFLERGGRLVLGPSGMSFDLNEASRTLEAEAVALGQIAPPAGDAEELARLRAQVEETRRQVAAVQKALAESPAARSTDALAHRIAERARLIVEAAPNIGSATIRVSISGFNARFFDVTGFPGRLALAILLVEAQRDRGEFAAVGFPVWVAAGRLLLESGVETPSPPFTEELWKAVSNAVPSLISWDVQDITLPPARRPA